GFAVSPIRVLASAMWLVGFAGCYNPSALPEGAPCQRSEQCPEPQQCVLGSCSRSAPPPVDAHPTPPPDAQMIDAMVDAMPVPCDADGLTCGGTPTVFLCGTQCWVKCTDLVSRATAETRCTGWTGALGEIDDATENGCVTMKISTATFWFGAIQGAGAMTPGDKWTWNGDATKLFNSTRYINWGTNKPDDADGNEDGAEQCGTIRPGGTWDDEGCNGSLGFFCRRSTFR
ncbi:MAG TPA: C-type lectin domain-containing protein, partial [Kofleriaceae bacterium]